MSDEGGEEPLLHRGEGDLARPTTTSASTEAQRGPQRGGDGTIVSVACASRLPEDDDASDTDVGDDGVRRRWHGSLLCPLGSCSYESIGICCSASACFPCPVTYPCMWSHTHARLLGLPKLATFSLFFFFLFVPWVALRLPLSVARAEACAPLDVSGGGSIPRDSVVLCLRLVKIDDVAFWMSVSLTASAFAVAGAMRFVARRRHGIEGGCWRGRRQTSPASRAERGGDGTSSPPSQSLCSLASAFVEDVLAWLLCPACALCQEARTAAANRCERGEWGGGRSGRRAVGRRGAAADRDGQAPPLLEAPRVPGTFVRGDEDGGKSDEGEP